MTRRLTLADVEAAEDLPREDVEVPEWGGTVTVRGLNLGERLELGRLFETRPDDVIFHTVAAALETADEEPMFPDLETGIAILRKRAAAPVKRLAEVAQRLSGFGADSDEIDATEKN